MVFAQKIAYPIHHKHLTVGRERCNCKEIMKKIKKIMISLYFSQVALKNAQSPK